jgi:hypothetical protein
MGFKRASRFVFGRDFSLKGEEAAEVELMLGERYFALASCTGASPRSGELGRGRTKAGLGYDI